MGKQYTKEYVIKECNEMIKPIDQFYMKSFLNRTGKTSDTGEYYTEVIAEFLLKEENIELLNSIERIDREDYSVDGHDGSYNSKSNRFEEHVAMDMYKMSKEDNYWFEGIGKVIAYQVPLKKQQKDKVGKIDLLSKNDDTAYMLELKAPGSSETMLRCLLESYTYLKRANQENLRRSLHIDDVKYIKAAPLVYFKGNQWMEMQEDRPKLRELMTKLCITDVFYYDMEPVKYQIKL